MKTVRMMVLCFLAVSLPWIGQARVATVSDLQLDATIHEDMLLGTLAFDLSDLEPEQPFPVLGNNVAVIAAKLPSRVRLVASDGSGAYRVEAEKTWWGRPRSGRVTIDFATTETNGVALWMPFAPVRTFSVSYNPDAVDISVPNAANLEKQEPAAGGESAKLMGNFPLGDRVRIDWKPAATRFLHSDSVLSCKAETVSFVSPGVIQHASRYVFSLPQGTAREYAFLVPKSANIVNTETDFSLLSQTIVANENPDYMTLTLTARTETRAAVIRLVYEDALPVFPCRATIEPIAPIGVLRTDGLLFVTPKGSVRIVPGELRNLLQTDMGAVPLVEQLEALHGMESVSGSAYRYTTTPSALEVELEDVVTAIYAENTFVLDVGDAHASIEATLQLDCRDAPADRIELIITGADDWTTTAITGQHVAEGDIERKQTVPGINNVVIPFERPVLGVSRVTLKMERKMDTSEPGTITIPCIAVKQANVQNGFIVAAAAQGIQLVSGAIEHLSEIHTASTPINKAGAQIAYRFRGDVWAAAINFTRAKTVIHSELFHLVSPGDGMLYASAVASFHISGAPTDTFTFHVPERLKQVDVTCADIDRWSRDGDTLTIKMSRRIMGDWTLLIAYEELLDYHGGECLVGEITTIGTESEMGFVVLAGPASLQAEEASTLPEGMIRIGKEEIPAGYTATLLAPVTAAWKYMRSPHTAMIRLTPLQSEHVLAQVVDFLSLETRVTRNGASVTHARYSVKNASGQYLTLKLPERAQLWRVSKLDEAGASISEIPSQLKGKDLLIPIERPRDPNQITTIEIQYATDNAKTPKRHVLSAPVSTAAPVTFVEWTLDAGDNLGISRVAGNLTRDSETTRFRFTRTSVMPEDAPLVLSVAVGPAWLSRIRWVDGIILGLFAIAMVVVFLFTRKWLAVAGFVASLGVLAVSADPRVSFLIPLAVVGLLAIGALRLFVRGVIKTVTPSKTPTLSPEDPPPLVDAGDVPTDEREGSLRLGLLLGLCVVAGIASALPQVLVDCGVLSGASAKVSVRQADMRINVTPPSRETPDTMALQVVHTIDCIFHQAGAYAFPRIDTESASFVILDTELPDSVMLAYGQRSEADADVPIVRLEPTLIVDGELFFVVSKPGKARLKLTLGQTGTPSDVHVATFKAVKSAVSIFAPYADWDVVADPLYGRVAPLPGDGESALFGYLGERDASIRVGIVPRRRDVESEALVMSADVDSTASIRAGVVDVITTIDYRVLQGVVRRVRVGIPESLVVVDIGGDVAEWSFDRVTRILSVAVQSPENGRFTVAVRCNTVAKNFPYTTTIAVLDVFDVTRQNGRLGIAATDAVLLNIGESAGCNPIRNEDFKPTETAWELESEGTIEKIRRAFRYDTAEAVAITLTAEAVKPEMRSTLEMAFSIGDERNAVSAQLVLTVAKAGVFSVNLEIPDGWIIETISGEKIASWDDRRKAGSGVDVFFGSRLMGTAQIYIVLSQQQQGVPERLNVPQMAVKGGVRQTGRVTITAERGVKLALDAHEGVVAVRADDRLEVTAPQTVRLDILRADWQAALTTQVLDPVVKPELLHSIAIAEGMLQHRVYLRCRIENAGVKQFRVVVPAPEASLTVSGRAIARVVPEGDPAADGSQVWLIELQGKVDNTYSATCFYQEPVDASAPVVVKPMYVVGAQRQTGWLVISGDSRIEVDASFSSAGLRVEDPRTIPEVFGAGNLSGALGCWKVLDSDTALSLRVTRNSAANMLPATVERVRQTTVLSLGGRTLTQTSVSLAVGRLRFLRIALPDESADLWTAQVNGVPVRASREAEGLLCIPLDSVTEGDTAEVTFVWADHPARRLPGKAQLESARFPDLPLRDIEWRLYVPSDYNVYLRNDDFDEKGWEGMSFASKSGSFDRGYYERRNVTERLNVLTRARSNFDEVGQMLETGDRARAQRVLKQAIDLSQADATLNEDARVQFENVAVQNVKIGFMNRRDALRASQNIFDEAGPQAVAGFNEGNFSREFARRLEGRLSNRDRQSLELVSAKIVVQQAAVSDTVPAISITLPEPGTANVYTRGLQTQPGGAMALELSVSRGIGKRFSSDGVWVYLAVLFATPVLWVLLMFAFGRASRPTRRDGLHFFS